MSEKDIEHSHCMMEKITDFLIEVGRHCMECEQIKIKEDKKNDEV